MRSGENPRAQIALLGGEAFVMAGAAAATYIIISRLVGPSLLGEYSLVLAWLYLTQSVSSFGIPEFVMREIGQHGSAVGDLFANSLALGLAFSGVAIAGMLGGMSLIGYEPVLESALTIALLAVVPLTLWQICRSTLLAQRRSSVVLSIATIETVCLLSANVYVLLNGFGIRELVVIFVAAKAASSVAALLLLVLTTSELGLRASVRGCREIARPIAAFGASRVLGLLSERLNIIMLSWWVSVSTVGHFAAATKIMELLVILPSIFGQILLTRFARTLANQSEPDVSRFYREIRLLFFLAFPTAVGVIVFAGPVLVFLFGDEFETSALVLRILMVFFMIETFDTLLATLLKACGRERDDVRYYAGHPIVNVLVNVALIPVLGGVGAALGRVSGSVCSTVIRYVHPVAAVEWWSLMKAPAAACVVAAAVAIPLAGVAHWTLAAAVYAAAVGGILLVHERRAARAAAGAD